MRNINKNKTISLFLAMVMLLVPIFAISTVSAQSTVTITFWYTENDAERPGVLALIEDFETANPGVEVDANQIGFFDCHDEYVSAFIAGEEPDVCRSVRDWVFEWAQSDMLAGIPSTAIVVAITALFIIIPSRIFIRIPLPVKSGDTNIAYLFINS